MAKQPDKGELMTNHLKKNGRCSLDTSDWCPTHYKETKNGFTLYGKTKNSLRVIDLNYDNLSAVCVLWESAVEVVGGNPKATANLLITDKSGNYVMMTRECN